ncbi:hypothetical protein GGX14DRAFT_678120 [Mycena pura]|uniref:Uncharacterized protein n=1 Tax=Mycena pura TaxID=153505 RepID=A0AAD6Y7D2_9AGAR|nr:hypothetical protein GGX14DRAFT_678120 [Mycena pura]
MIAVVVTDLTAASSSIHSTVPHGETTLCNAVMTRTHTIAAEFPLYGTVTVVGRCARVEWPTMTVDCATSRLGTLVQGGVQSMFGSRERAWAAAAVAPFQGGDARALQSSGADALHHSEVAARRRGTWAAAMLVSCSTAAIGSGAHASQGGGGSGQQREGGGCPGASQVRYSAAAVVGGEGEPTHAGGPECHDGRVVGRQETARTHSLELGQRGLRDGLGRRKRACAQVCRGEADAMWSKLCRDEGKRMQQRCTGCMVRVSSLRYSAVAANRKIWPAALSGQQTAQARRTRESAVESGGWCHGTTEMGNVPGVER